MPFCDQCGSTSKDNEGFCKGCGARLAIPAPSTPQENTGSLNPSQPTPRPTTLLSSIDLVPLRSKSVWIAIFRTALFGPIGMLYSTVTGALVMAVASAVALIFASGRWLWVTWAVCIVWAALAARE